MQRKFLFQLSLIGLLSLSSGLSQAITRSAEVSGANTVIGDRFGASIDIDGGYIIVGAPLAKVDEHAEAGKAYIFNATNELEELILPIAADYDQFGYSVAIDKDTIIVSAIYDDKIRVEREPQLDGDGNELFDTSDPPRQLFENVAYVETPDTGVIHIYRLLAGTWYREGGILSEDSQTGDWLGYSVDTEDNHVVAGSPLRDIGSDTPDAGGVYVFTRYTNDWIDQKNDKINEGVVSQLLQPSDLSAGDWFGSAVAISNNTILVGADGSDLDGNSSGAAYVYTRNQDGNWNQQARLRPSDAGAAQFFGRSVAIDGNTIAIGAYQANSNKGAVYIFTRDASGQWAEQSILTDTNSEADDHFGASVAISDSIVLAGAYRENDRQGVIHLFDRDINDGWNQSSTLIAGTASFDDFAFSLAMAGDDAAAGIPEINDFTALGRFQHITDLETEIDTDFDGTDNSVDTDDDNDTVLDINDLFPTNEDEYSDIDLDGVGDNADAFIYNATESFDTDGDGLGNNLDTDDDNDGVPDIVEVTNNTDSLAANAGDAEIAAENSADDEVDESDSDSSSSSGGSGFAGVETGLLLLILLGQFGRRRMSVLYSIKR